IRAADGEALAEKLRDQMPADESTGSRDNNQIALHTDSPGLGARARSTRSDSLARQTGCSGPQLDRTWPHKPGARRTPSDTTISSSVDRVDVFSGIQRRRRYSVDQKLALLAEAAQPGMSIFYVARRRGILVSSASMVALETVQREDT